MVVASRNKREVVDRQLRSIEAVVVGEQDGALCQEGQTCPKTVTEVYNVSARSLIHFMGAMVLELEANGDKAGLMRHHPGSQSHKVPRAAGRGRRKAR